MGLRLCLEIIPTRPVAEHDAVSCEKLPLYDDVVRIGLDGGRVRLSTSVNSENDNVLIASRKSFYYHQHHHRLTQWENEQRNGTPWGHALMQLAQTGGLKNTCLNTWRNFLQVQIQHLDVCIAEQINNIERARKKMFRFRMKKRWLDNPCIKLLQPAIRDKKYTIIGIGDGKFASGGKGEQSVPTEKLMATLKKSIKIKKLERLVKIVKVDEYNTTKCCHRCGNEMQKLTTSYGKECLRYRLCTNCKHETTDKRRHRDVNAAPGGGIF